MFFWRRQSAQGLEGLNPADPTSNRQGTGSQMAPRLSELPPSHGHLLPSQGTAGPPFPIGGSRISGSLLGAAVPPLLNVARESLPPPQIATFSRAPLSRDMIRRQSATTSVPLLSNDAIGTLRPARQARLDRGVSHPREAWLPLGSAAGLWSSTTARVAYQQPERIGAEQLPPMGVNPLPHHEEDALQPSESIGIQPFPPPKPATSVSDLGLYEIEMLTSEDDDSRTPPESDEEILAQWCILDETQSTVDHIRLRESARLENIAIEERITDWLIYCRGAGLYKEQ